MFNIIGWTKTDKVSSSIISRTFQILFSTDHHKQVSQTEWSIIHIHIQYWMKSYCTMWPYMQFVLCCHWNAGQVYSLVPQVQQGAQGIWTQTPDCLKGKRPLCQRALTFDLWPHPCINLCVSGGQRGRETSESKRYDSRWGNKGEISMLAARPHCSNAH